MPNPKKEGSSNGNDPFWTKSDSFSAKNNSITYVCNEDNSILVKRVSSTSRVNCVLFINECLLSIASANIIRLYSLPPHSCMTSISDNFSNSTTTHSNGINCGFSRLPTPIKLYGYYFDDSKHVHSLSKSSNPYFYKKREKIGCSGDMYICGFGLGKLVLYRVEDDGNGIIGFPILTQLCSLYINQWILDIVIDPDFSHDGIYGSHSIGAFHDLDYANDVECKYTEKSNCAIGNGSNCGKGAVQSAEKHSVMLFVGCARGCIYLYQSNSCKTNGDRDNSTCYDDTCINKDIILIHEWHCSNTSLLYSLRIAIINKDVYYNKSVCTSASVSNGDHRGSSTDSTNIRLSIYKYDIRIVSGTVFSSINVWYISFYISEHNDTYYIYDTSLYASSSVEPFRYQPRLSPINMYNSSGFMNGKVYDISARGNEGCGVLVHDGLNGHRGVIFSLKFSDDNVIMVSASDDRTVRVHKLHNGDFYSNSSCNKNNASNLIETISKFIFSCNCSNPTDAHRSYANTNVFGSSSNGVDPRSYTCISVLRGHTCRVWDVDICERYLIISVGEDSVCKIWTLDGSCLTTLTGHIGRGIRTLHTNAKQKPLIPIYFYYHSDANGIALINTSSLPSADCAEICGRDAIRGYLWVATGGEDGDVKLWDLEKIISKYRLSDERFSSAGSDCASNNSSSGITSDTIMKNNSSSRSSSNGNSSCGSNSSSCCRSNTSDIGGLMHFVLGIKSSFKDWIREVIIIDIDRILAVSNFGCMHITNKDTITPITYRTYCEDHRICSYDCMVITCMAYCNGVIVCGTSKGYCICYYVHYDTSSTSYDNSSLCKLVKWNCYDNCRVSKLYLYNVSDDYVAFPCFNVLNSSSNAGGRYDSPTTCTEGITDYLNNSCGNTGCNVGNYDNIITKSTNVVITCNHNGIVKLWVLIVTDNTQIDLVITFQLDVPPNQTRRILCCLPLRSFDIQHSDNHERDTNGNGNLPEALYGDQFLVLLFGDDYGNLHMCEVSTPVLVNHDFNCSTTTNGSYQNMTYLWQQSKGSVANRYKNMHNSNCKINDIIYYNGYIYDICGNGNLYVHVLNSVNNCENNGVKDDVVGSPSDITYYSSSSMDRSSSSDSRSSKHCLDLECLASYKVSHLSTLSSIFVFKYYKNADNNYYNMNNNTKNINSNNNTSNINGNKYSMFNHGNSTPHMRSRDNNTAADLNLINNIYICGFVGNWYILWDVSNCMEIWRIACRGGRRPLACVHHNSRRILLNSVKTCYGSGSDSNGIDYNNITTANSSIVRASGISVCTFAFAEGRTIHVYVLPSPHATDTNCFLDNSPSINAGNGFSDKDKDNNCCEADKNIESRTYSGSLRPGLHGREIWCGKFIDENHLITGSEDNSIKIFKINMKADRHECLEASDIYYNGRLCNVNSITNSIIYGDRYTLCSVNSNDSYSDNNNNNANNISMNNNNGDINNNSMNNNISNHSDRKMYETRNDDISSMTCLSSASMHPAGVKALSLIKTVYMYHSRIAINNDNFQTSATNPLVVSVGAKSASNLFIIQKRNRSHSYGNCAQSSPNGNTMRYGLKHLCGLGCNGDDTRIMAVDGVLLQCIWKTSNEFKRVYDSHVSFATDSSSIYNSCLSECPAKGVTNTSWCRDGNGAYPLLLVFMGNSSAELLIYSDILDINNRKGKKMAHADNGANSDNLLNHLTSRGMKNLWRPSEVVNTPSAILSVKAFVSKYNSCQNLNILAVVGMTDGTASVYNVYNRNANILESDSNSVTTNGDSNSCSFCLGVRTILPSCPVHQAGVNSIAISLLPPATTITSATTTSMTDRISYVNDENILILTCGDDQALTLLHIRYNSTNNSCIIINRCTYTNIHNSSVRALALAYPYIATASWDQYIALWRTNARTIKIDRAEAKIEGQGNHTYNDSISSTSDGQYQYSLSLEKLKSYKTNVYDISNIDLIIKKYASENIIDAIQISVVGGGGGIDVIQFSDISSKQQTNKHM